MKSLYLILFFLTAGSLLTYAQLQRSTSLPGAPGKGPIVAFPRGIRQSSGEVSYLLAIDTAGNINLLPLHANQRYDTARRPYPARKPFLKVHGNVMYDYYYQSGLDTPYQQKDIYQHTVQTYLDLTIREQYPVRVAFTTARGNSTLFRDITGINMQYTNRDFKNLLYDKLQNWDGYQVGELQRLQLEKNRLNAKSLEFYQLKDWLSSPAQLQRLVEAKERKLYGRKDTLPGIGFDSLFRRPAMPSMGDISSKPGKPSMPGIPSLPEMPSLDILLRYKGHLRDSTVNHPPADTSFENYYAARQHQLDTLQERLRIMDSTYHVHEAQMANLKGNIIEKLMSSKNNQELNQHLNELNLPDTVLPKGYKTLLAIRSIGLGRTLADYSELTAKGISITGVQAEFNPSYYVAVAAGTIDYRFRNYVVNSGAPSQYLALIRGGYGMKEGNHLFFTYYMGKKQLYNLNASADSASKPNYHIQGLALEGRWQIAKNTYMTGEIAKSSYPYYQQSGHSMLSMIDHSNEAWSMSANSLITQTGTKLAAVYKVMGAGFQSFSLYTTGSKQIAWTVRVDQPFFKQQLLVTASVRRNDYTSQYQQADYKSNTIFKSIQATLRIKHYPVLSVGYYPSSQLTKLSDGTYMESTFYTMVGTLSHFYKVHHVMMNTMLSYTRFYNKQDDSSFVYYNTKNLLLNHTMFLGKFTIQGTGQAAMNGDYDLYGGDGNVLYKVKSWLDIGGGIKYSYQTVYELRNVGYTGTMRVAIPYMGQIELMADKGFIPGAERRLVSNNTGRITYTKTF
ncbi:hypothetical protein [Chitinophaga sancti]|uniref:Uncharacterized protein n=1 Tax=Chitinophaga sancti TaxID=1004 RepID=A0A1K1SBZ3_9BACT|nr:hypothetical protein [Chitinophaga sancti]WQD63585.1 hypothetical protein U0033_04195 [Chitinophaga sancti]WQG90789.1 hypothetical protein SR876_04720 [Chitinophaga sancti]SFW81872.1 hypothetical protein SAMN05661012_05156 [Chitinophaga sancti]